MLKKYTYKTQFFILLGILVVSLITVWKIALSPTFNLASEYRRNKTDYEKIAQAPMRIALVKKQLDKLNSQIFSANQQNTDFREGLLMLISDVAKRYGAQISSVEPEHVIKSAGYLIETEQLILEGKFNNLLQLLHFMENESGIGKLMSATFYTEESRKTKKKRLYLKMIFQNISK